MRYFGLLAPRSQKRTTTAIFLLLGQQTRPRPNFTCAISIPRGIERHETPETAQAGFRPVVILGSAPLAFPLSLRHSDRASRCPHQEVFASSSRSAHPIR